jgi:hypothetical protein
MEQNKHENEKRLLKNGSLIPQKACGREARKV